MNQFRVKKRPTGAAVTLGRLGHPEIVTATGGALTVVTAASEPGFNPLDLLYSSLAACLALSARIAASRMGVLDRFEKVTVHVSGEKAEEEPSRIVRFDIRIAIEGDFDGPTRDAIAHAAEDICTVSNTLRGDAEFILSIAG
ncbi:OsmC family protein [Rhizobium sp. UGM030330-04]|uniref:OsmC family protein n=1 Tax=Rhizobium sp. UGM030330-04 TaxID=1378077 RepID=UPI000DA05850|nr:OsmC family protein [Rhizobium sp. UGM030330-04]PYG54780.1 putative OsmC-like protein [Rhizobium sp. UGM030330-04]